MDTFDGLYLEIRQTQANKQYANINTFEKTSYFIFKEICMF